MSSIGRLLRGPYLSRPAQALDGCIHKSTDLPIESVMKGGAWRRYLGGMALVDPPDVSVWTLIEAAAGTKVVLSNYGGGTLLSYKAGGTGTVDLHIAKRTAPTPPYLIATHLMLSSVPNVFGQNPATAGNFAFAGLVWRQSSNGSVERFGIGNVSSIANMLWRPSTANNTGASPTFTDGSDYLAPSTLPLDLAGHGIWLFQGDDGVNRYGFLSIDGQPTLELTAAARRPRTSGLTPDEVGIYVSNEATTGSTNNIQAWFTSYEIRTSGLLAAVDVGIVDADGRPSKIGPPLPLMQAPNTLHGVARAPRIINGPVIR